MDTGLVQITPHRAVIVNQLGMLLGRGVYLYTLRAVRAPAGGLAEGGLTPRFEHRGGGGQSYGGGGIA